MSPIDFTRGEAMMTTEFMPGGRGKVRTPWLPQHSDANRVRMNWIVVTDHKGTRRLRSHWNAIQDA